MECKCKVPEPRLIMQLKAFTHVLKRVTPQFMVVCKACGRTTTIDHGQGERDDT